MQSLLCLDFSSPILEAGIVSYDEKTTRLTLEQVVREDDPKLFAHPSQVQQEQTPGASEEVFTPPTLEERLNKLVSSLKELLVNETTGNALSLWSSVVAIIPSRDTFSLVVPLPINEARLIQKVLPLEIEDSLPLLAEPFHIESTIAAPSGEKGAEIITTLATKTLLNDHLQPLRNLGLEPDTFTTLEGILSGLGGYLTDEQGNYVLVCQDASNPSHWAVAVYVSHAIRHCEHVFGDTMRASQALKSLLLCSEAKFNCKVSTVYTVGPVAELPGISPIKAPLIESLASFDITPKYLAALTAITTDEQKSTSTFLKSILAINFRSGEFAYKLQLRELLTSVRKLLPAFTACFFSLLATIITWYAIREYTISRLNTRARDEIASVINNSSLETSSAQQTLKLRIEEVRARLRDLGSVGKVSPLDALLAITKDFPLQNQVEVRTISIKEKKITIEGSAPEYDSIDKMERALQLKRSTYCRVKSTPTKKGDSGVDFSFEIYLCD